MTLTLIINQIRGKNQSATHLDDNNVKCRLISPGHMFQKL